jgi:serine protease AprX
MSVDEDASLPRDDPRKSFDPKVLDRSLIAIPLLDEIERDLDKPQDIILDLNLTFGGGRASARELGVELLQAFDAGVYKRLKSELTDQYLFAKATGRQVQQLAQGIEAAARDGVRPIHRIWLDHKLTKFTNASIATVKGDAARSAFNAEGSGIVWAVCDTGVDATHPHFMLHDNLTLNAPLAHRDFTNDLAESEAASEAAAKLDRWGHGTHVAGIIAGEFVAERRKVIEAYARRRDEAGEVTRERLTDVTRMGGVAPKTKILSLKVLDDQGQGLSSNLIAAIAYIQKLNNNGRRLLVHGLNMSVGYEFDPEWFACGQSPLCVEVDRLVKSGVCVVVAAGNTGHGWVQAAGAGVRSAGLGLTINDPGNAALAVTVGSTHRDMPHIYGVSYFSSKGPTGDGRLKPDLVAPGEKIVSCLSRDYVGEGVPPAETSTGTTVARYREDSGTSMAAPHVSGAMAAFLSVRREFIGRPEAVKEIFLSTATDLKRERYFQGHGLIDLMRALQAV